MSVDFVRMVAMHLALDARRICQGDQIHPDALVRFLADIGAKQAAGVAKEILESKSGTAAACAAASAARARSMMGQKSQNRTASQGSVTFPPSDDLTRIKGIGIVMERRLNGLGVRRYSDIAAWSNPDIVRISQVIDFKERIERDKWIEQARILAAGGTTDFARRVDRGKIETDKLKPAR